MLAGKHWASALAAAWLMGCASLMPNSNSPPEAWRLVPEATVLGERRQFFVYGRGLDSAGTHIDASHSVTAEKGWAKPDGRVLSLYLKVDRIRDDSTALGEKPGLRLVTLRTRDTAVTLPLKVLNETER